MHLKRSRFQRATTSYSKIRCPVQFPASFRLDEEGLTDVLHPEATHGGVCGNDIKLGGSFAETAQLIRQAQASALAEEEAMALEVADDEEYDEGDVMEVAEGTNDDDVVAMERDGDEGHQGWSCQQCTLLNEAHHAACQVCNAPRHEDRDHGGANDDGEIAMVIEDSPGDVDEAEPVGMHQGEEQEQGGAAQAAAAAVASMSAAAAAVIDLTLLEEASDRSSQSQSQSQSQEVEQGEARGPGNPPPATSSSTRAPGDCDNAAAAGGDGSAAGRARWHYRLSAVVRHMGNNVFTGHYICDIFTAASAASRVGKALKPGGSWRRCDDSAVAPITEEEVLADQTTPYILFYERVCVV